MTSRTRNLALILAASSGVYACSSAPPSSSSSSASWDCHSADVPNGSTVECVSTSAGALTVSTYDCTSGDTTYACPPPGSTSDVGSTGTSGDYDAGDNGGFDGSTGVGTGSSGGSGDGQPDGGYTNGGDTTGGDTTDGGGIATGSGNGNGNGGGGSNGNGGGNPHADGGTGNPHSDGGGGNPHGGDTTGSGAGGGYASGGGDNGGGYTCSCDGSQTTCTKPPTCQPGSHASACGACVPDTSGTDDCQPPSTGGCWVTGGGFIVDADGNDSFGGNAMPMKAGYIRGEWQHVDHGTGNKAHGQAQYLVCRHVDEPGPGKPNGPKHNFDINQVYFGGPARWFTNGAWADGYWFDVMAEDHGEGKSPNATNYGGPDYYHFTIRKVAGANQSGTVVYDTEENMSGGNIQIHPPNNGHPYTSSQLPSWVSLQP